MLPSKASTVNQDIYLAARKVNRGQDNGILRGREDSENDGANCAGSLLEGQDSHSPTCHILGIGPGFRCRLCTSGNHGKLYAAVDSYRAANSKDRVALASTP